jgi:hypothetical protein
MCEHKNRGEIWQKMRSGKFIDKTKCMHVYCRWCDCWMYAYLNDMGAYECKDCQSILAMPLKEVDE